MQTNDSSDEDEFETTDESDQEEENTYAWSPTSKMLLKTLTKKSEPPIFKGYNYIDWEKAVKQGMEFCKLTKDKHMLTYAKAYMHVTRDQRDCQVIGGGARSNVQDVQGFLQSMPRGLCR